MAREKFPSDDVDRLMVRFPPGMRDHIAEVARANGRSMNSEIVARLAASLEGPQKVEQVSTGKDQTLNLIKAMVEANEKIVDIGGGIKFHFTIVPEEYMKTEARNSKVAEDAELKAKRSRKKT